MKKPVRIAKTPRKRINNEAELKLREAMRKKKNSWPLSMRKKLMILPV